MITGAPTLLLDVAAAHMRDRRREARDTVGRPAGRSLRLLPSRRR